jgi:hypothetical protein
MTTRLPQLPSQGLHGPAVLVSRGHDRKVLSCQQQETVTGWLLCGWVEGQAVVHVDIPGRELQVQQKRPKSTRLGGGHVPQSSRDLAVDFACETPHTIDVKQSAMVKSQENQLSTQLDPR